MNQIRNMDMDFYSPQENPSKNLEKVKNAVLIAIVFAVLQASFHLTGPALITMSLCFIVMALLGVDYAIGTIVTYWFLVPADMIFFMFVYSGAGNFPVYIILIIVFILIQLIENGLKGGISFTRFVEKKTFLAFSAFFGVFVCILFGYMIFSSRVIISNAVKFIAQTLGMLILVKMKRFKQEDVNRIMHYMFFLVIIVNIIAVAEQAFGFNIYDIYGAKENSEWFDYVHESTNESWRVKSTFGNSLIFSTSMVMCLPIVEYFRRVNNKTWLDIIRVGILLTGSVLSGSRSGTAIIAIYLIYYFFSSKGNKKLLFICLIPFAIIVFLNFVDFSLLVQRSENISSDGSLLHRLSAYGVYFRLIKISPIWGVGLGNTYNILSNYISGNFTVNTLDNTFMDLSLAIGLFGFACIIVIIYEMTSMTLDHNRKHMLHFSIFTMVFISFFLNASKYQSLWGMFWLFLFMFSDICCNYKLLYFGDVVDNE